jgi:hypothetical protein
MTLSTRDLFDKDVEAACFGDLEALLLLLSILSMLLLLMEES